MPKRLIIVAVVAVLAAVEAIPLLFMETNPPVQAEPKWDSPQTRALAQRACFDCHSNETVWPWYSRIAPVSYWVAFDTLRGRNHLNFSEWGTRPLGGRGEEGESVSDIRELITRGEMPPDSYVGLHPAAQLTAQEQQQLINGLEASLQP
jgi:mono/diheme cytochrome c family protein